MLDSNQHIPVPETGALPFGEWAILNYNRSTDNNDYIRLYIYVKLFSQIFFYRMNYQGQSIIINKENSLCDNKYEYKAVI